MPAGFKKEDLVLTDASLNRAVSRTLTELFRQGMFEDTYADPRKAAEVVATKADWEEASRVHRESVVLLKNDGTLPLKDGTKVYAEPLARAPRPVRPPPRPCARCWAMSLWWTPPMRPRWPC